FLVEGRVVSDVVLRIRIVPALERTLGEAFRIGALLVERSEALALLLLEFLRRERRLGERLGGEAHQVGQMRSQRLPLRGGLRVATADGELRAQLVEPVLERLPIVLARAGR